jgi:predicted Rossmann fold nucleotide-binding protein DprA/Smf involved in DNA uptake
MNEPQDYPQNSTLSPDTEAILLLCGRFGNERGELVSPLTQKEYEALTRWLLERKLRPADLLAADSTLLGDLVQARLDSAKVRALLQRGTALALAMEKWRRSGLWILSRSDIAYPRRLKRKLGQSAPPLLYGAGDPSLLENGGVAIVGSRDVSQAGLEFTRTLAHACVRDGLGVVSGGAKGVDAAAMQACGEAGGIVVGVLAADLMRASVNRQNRQGLTSGQLVLVSPFNPEAGFSVGNAMARNRYIYALADYAVVVDSAEGEGGTWAGAIEDLRHAWTPLYVRDAEDKPGNRALIAKGARGFTYQFEMRESLKEFLALSESATSFELKLAQPATTEDMSIPIPAKKSDESELVLNNSPVTAYELGLQTFSEGCSEKSFDLFPLFLERLSSFLGGASKTDEEIRTAFGLEKGQVKTWLAAAVSSGTIEKLKKPITYALPKQKKLS